MTTATAQNPVTLDPKTSERSRPVEHTLSTSSPLMDASALATIVGVSDKTIYRWTNSHKIPSYRIGNTIRFDVGQVLAEMRDGI